MFVLQMLFSMHLAWATTEMPIQQDVDHAFTLILKTEIGRSICRDILGADPQALEQHLGISAGTAARAAQGCRGSEASEWIYPTSPSDIRKLSIKAEKPRRYKLVLSDENFPIESWTDSITNVTTILTHTKSIPFFRLAQVLAHETAVYFDSKSHPLLQGAQEIPHLRGLNLKTPGKMDPLVAATDPLVAHTLTFLRALQVEFAIMNELLDKGEFGPPFVATKDLNDPYLNYLISDRCAEECIRELVLNTRGILMPYNLPLLAFSPHFRAVILPDLARANLPWGGSQWADAQRVLNTWPENFRKNVSTGDFIADLATFFRPDETQRPGHNKKAMDQFLDGVLWPLEQPALWESKFSNGLPLLVFLKKPLLSGYNIALTSGPRVRVRSGVIE